MIAERTKPTVKDIGAAARVAMGFPSFDKIHRTILDYVDAVREQVESSAMRDGAAAALELLAAEINTNTGCFTTLDGYRYAEHLESRIAFYKKLADPDKYTPGEFADHAARHAGAARAIEKMLQAMKENGLLGVEYIPSKIVRLMREDAVKYRTAQKRL